MKSKSVKSVKYWVYLIREHLCIAWTFLQHQARGAPQHELAAKPPETQRLYLIPVFFPLTENDSLKSANL